MRVHKFTVTQRNGRHANTPAGCAVASPVVLLDPASLAVMCSGPGPLQQPAARIQALLFAL